MILRTLVRRFAISAAALLPLAAAATPTAYVSFYPGSSANLGDTVILSISLLDSGSAAITNAQLSAGVFQFPSGMTASASVPPSTNCSGGTVTSAPGSTTMSFSVPSVPASTSCGIEVYVDFAGPGTYTAALPAGGITTDQGPATNAQDGVITIIGPTVTYVTNTSDAGPGSLRDAINQVNANCVSPNTIAFNIPTTGVAVIAPLLQLPAITCDQTTIDGYSQPGSARNGSPQGCTSPTIQVELSGSACGSGCNGLLLQGNNIVVQGLAIHSFSSSGIITAGAGDSIYGNIIGADATGSTLHPNLTGIVLQSGYANIGSGNDSDRNLIVGNTAAGIDVEGAEATIDNNQLGGTPSCGVGNGNTTGIFFSDSAFSSTVSNNFIRYGTGEGVSVMRGAVGTVRLGSNSIADNGGIGVDMGNDGVTVNDEASVPYDQDGVQNYPEITGITFNGSVTTITGILKSIPNRSGSIIVYSNSRVIPGFTEGETVVATSTAATDANGDATWTATAVGNVDNLSATILFDVCGDGCLRSSEFSPTVTQASVAPPVGPVLQISQLGSFDAIVNYAAVDVDFTLTNIGDQDLTFGATPFSLTPGDFTLSPFTGCVGVTLKPGESCNLKVRFAPAAAGPDFAALTITSNANGSPVTENLSGYGLLPLQISIVTPANPAAGGPTTATLTVTNPNTGSAPSFGGVSGNLTIDPAFTIVAANPPSCPTFDPAALSAPLKRGTKAAVVTAGGYYVAAGQTCTLYDVQLTAPTTPGAYTFTVGVDAVIVNSPTPWENPTAVSATVTVAAASLTVSPSSLAFGNVTTGASSPPQTVTVSSASRTTVPVASITAPAGYVVTTNCTAGVPPTGCTINVAFAPSSAGPDNGNLVIDAGGATYSVALTGTGTAPPQVFAATVSPSSLTFAPRSVGTRSPAAAVTVTNTGTSPLSISDITISGDFAYDSTCPITVTLAPGASCNVNVTFAPLVTGARTGVLTVTTNDPASLHSIPLSGSGVILPTATLAVDPGAIDFGTLTLGATSAVQLVTLTNTGNAAASLSTATGTPFALASPPAGSTACGSTLGAGASCVVGLTFTPVVQGGVPGTLVVNSTASNPRVTVSLSGTGISGPPPRALTVPASLDFGSQPFGTRSAARSLTIANTTAQQVTITDIAVAGDFAADDGCPVVPARGTCSISVYFTPTARGGRGGQVTITVAGDTRPYAVILTGDGGPNPLPVLNASPARIGFGNALVGPAGPQKSITLTNAGELPVVLGPIVSPGDFFVTSHCGGTIPVGASCTLDVVFYPRLTGLRTQTLQVPSNAGNSPARVDLSGTGCSLPNAAHARIGQLVCSQ